MITSLAIQEIQTNNCCFLRLVDNSYYNPDFEVENGILEILPPGASCYQYFEVQPYFNTSFNTASLGLLLRSSVSATLPLPDGVYNIKYSVKPNQFLMVEYNLFRNCQLLMKWKVEACKLRAAKHNLTRAQFESYLKELNNIKEDIDASKYMVEEFNDIQRGTDMYNESYESLKRYTKNLCL